MESEQSRSVSKMTDNLSDSLVRRIQKEQEALDGGGEQKQQPNLTYPSLQSSSGEQSKTSSDESLDHGNDDEVAGKLKNMPTPPPEYGDVHERRPWSNGGLNHRFKYPRMVDPDFEGKVGR